MAIRPHFGALQLPSCIIYPVEKKAMKNSTQVLSNGASPSQICFAVWELWSNAILYTSMSEKNEDTG